MPRWVFRHLVGRFRPCCLYPNAIPEIWLTTYINLNLLNTKMVWSLNRPYGSAASKQIVGDPLGLLTSWPDEAFLTLGGRHSGTQFHAHGPAFLLLAKGKKRLLDGKFFKKLLAKIGKLHFFDLFWWRDLWLCCRVFYCVLGSLNSSESIAARTYARKNNESLILLKSASG